MNLSDFETCDSEGVRMAWVPLDTLLSIRWDKNPKGHNIDALKRMIGHYGALDAPVINADNGTLLAGHGRAETYQKLFNEGREPPERVRVRDGQWEIATQIVQGVTDHAGAAVALNRSVELGGWDDVLLNEVLVELDDLELVGFDDFSMPDFDIPDPLDGYGDDELNRRDAGRMRRNESLTEVVAIGRFIGAAPKE